MLLVGIATLIIATGATWIATPAVVKLAERLGAMDLPGRRKAHTRPTPRIGGVAVYFGFVTSLAFAAWATGNLWSIPQPGVYWRGLALAATCLLLIGLADDLWGLSFYWKFAGQLLAAVYVWQCGFVIDLVTDPISGGVIGARCGVSTMSMPEPFKVRRNCSVNLVSLPMIR